MRVAVTGAARGIGLAVARAFAGQGASVVLGDLDLDLARAEAARLDTAAHPLDVRDRASFAAFLAAAGPVDVLVNNAGVAPAGRFVEAAPAALDLLIDVNLRGVVHGMHLVLPDMLARGSGHVVNIASLSGRVPLPGAAVYTATKHAVVGLSEAVRAELRGTGVRVTAVLPTFVPTEVTSGLPLRGVPTVSAAKVADAVVRAVRRGGPPVLAVPRWLGALPRIAAYVPYRVRDAIGAGRSVDAVAREAYEHRISQQYAVKDGQ